MNENLPDEQFVPITRAHFIVTVLSVVVLFLLADVVVLVHLKGDDSDVMIAKWQLLENLDDPVDMLVLGDSSAGLGVDPEVWAKTSGESVINLGTYGISTVVNDAMMLETYVERFGSPEKIAIVHVYDTWHRPMKPSVMFRIPFNVIWKLRSSYFDGYESLRPAMAHLFPLYYQDVTVPDLIKNALVEKLFRPDPEVELAVRNSNGFYALREPRPELVALDTRNRLESLRTGMSPSLSPMNAKALQRIKSLADTHGFDVYLVNSPLSEELSRDPSFQEFYSNLKLTLSEFASSSPRVRLLMDEIMTFDANSMQNSNHLLYDSAQVYSEWLHDNTISESRP